MTPTPSEPYLSCEHASLRVPARYACLFGSARAQRALSSHRGSDIGSLALARSMARRLGADLKTASWSRLLVDLNRSPHHPKLFSEFTRSLDADERRSVVARFHAPYRAAIEAALERKIAARGGVCHIGVHSFTPVLSGHRRTADVGLLYDPGRRLERELCGRWLDAVREIDPTLRARRNYPYLGTADGLTTALRRRFGAAEYAGIELEVNQAVLTDSRRAAAIARTLAAGLERALAGC